MRQETVRFGVLGCSSVARRRSIPALVSCPGTSLTAVASRDPEKAKRFAAEFDCAATTYEELLVREDIDAIYVPLPAALHVTWGLRVLEAGRHLLLEKPAATTAQSARELVRLAVERDLVLRENFTFPFHSQHRAVAELVAEGRLGTVRSFSGAFCFPPLPDCDIRYSAPLGGGSLLDAGVYPVRAAQLLLGDELRVVGGSLRIDPVREVDVAGQALLVSAGGVLVDVRFGFEHTYGSWYSLWGSGARLLVDRAFTPPASWSPVLHIDGQDHSERRALSPDDQFEAAIASFADAVLTGRTARHPEEERRCEQLVRTLELVDDIARLAVRVPAGGGS